MTPSGGADGSGVVIPGTTALPETAQPENDHEKYQGPAQNQAVHEPAVIGAG
jgi:hypothetical protein